jgi:hypothetical protein
MRGLSGFGVSRWVLGAGAGLAGLFGVTSSASAENAACPQAALSTATQCVFSVAGTYAFTVPAGVSSVDVVAVGAAGGEGSPGLGGGVIGAAGASVEDRMVPVSVDEALPVRVGGVGADGTVTRGGDGGSPGGGAGGDNPTPNLMGAGEGGGGGGYSGVFDTSAAALVIAGGGGGSGAGDLGSGGDGDTGSGGSTGISVIGVSAGGVGATTRVGCPGGDGAGGAGFEGGGNGFTGSSLQGGGGGNSIRPGGLGGGGGGGGYCGGGGGGGDGGGIAAGGGGGGGSSFGVTGLTNGAVATTAASVTISYVLPPPPGLPSITTPADGATFTQGQVVDAAYSCADSASGPGLNAGVAGCAGTVADGAAIDTSTIGSHMFSVTATSQDGESTTQSVSYSVSAAAVVATTTTAPTTSTTTPPAPTPIPSPPAPKARTVPTKLTGISVSGSVLWCRGKDCRYPTARLRFDLNQAATLRLVLRTRSQGHWRQVATAAVHGHGGVNRHRIAGRWHGLLVPAGPVEILVEAQQGGRWVTVKTIHLTVHHAPRHLEGPRGQRQRSAGTRPTSLGENSRVARDAFAAGGPPMSSGTRPADPRPAQGRDGDLPDPQDAQSDGAGAVISEM